MYIKKIIAAAFAVCLLMFTACGKDSTEGKASATESETTTTETTPASADTETTSDSETDTESTEADGTEDGEAANPLMPIADAAIAADEWPSLWEVTDAQLISDFFTLDAANENYKNLLVLQCPMSANMSEIIIIEAEDVNAAKTDLESRQEKAKSQDAFYPDDVERAGASIVGAEGNYAYFLMGDHAANAEKTIVDYIKNMG